MTILLILFGLSLGTVRAQMAAPAPTVAVADVSPSAIDQLRPALEQIGPALEQTRIDHWKLSRTWKDQLHGAKDRYKIKLKSAGYRLVYQVFDTEIVVLVIAVGKREGSAVYEAAAKR